MPTYHRGSFINRGYAQVGEEDAAIYLDEFLQAYNNNILLDGIERKAYFFDTATVVEQGGQSNSNVLIGSYELNQEFHSLQDYTPPLNGVLKMFTKGERAIQAIMFPAPITNNTYINGFGGQGVTASSLETTLGLQAGDVQNFVDDGTNISFHISVNYVIPSGAFANTSVTEYLDNGNKVTKINDQAFFSCLSLTKTKFNAATYVGVSAFGNCLQGTVHSFNSVNMLYTTALYGNELMTILSLPNCTKLAAGCLSSCVLLNSLYVPLVSVVEDNVFEACSQLMSIELPLVTSLGPLAFALWGGAGYTLTVPTAMANDPAVLQTQGAGTTVVLI